MEQHWSIESMEAGLEKKYIFLIGKKQGFRSREKKDVPEAP